MAQVTTEEDGLPAPQRYWAAASIWLALTLSVLDGSIANIALPTIAADLNAAATDSVWVVNAYQLAIVVSLLPWLPWARWSAFGGYHESKRSAGSLHLPFQDAGWFEKLKLESGTGLDNFALAILE